MTPCDNSTRTDSPTVLCILDGLGLNPNQKGNAVAQANTPTLDNLLKNYPNTTLTTHGERVGLPEGQMGNSEVGHLNIGAGRVVDQWLLLISKALKNDWHLNLPSFKEFTSASKASKRIHLIGLLSDGGVHSHSEHSQLLINSLLKTTTAELALHIITDGRDVSPHAALKEVEKLQGFFQNNARVQILTVTGRFFAMDRDQRWERVEKAYSSLTGQGPISNLSVSAYIEESYKQNITDEFIEPTQFASFSIDTSDSFIFWNFRADRMREIVSAICLPDFKEFKRIHPLPTNERTLCFANYSAKFNLPYLFSQGEIKNYLGQVVSDAGLTQLRVAETEKYPHVTYFLNGGSEIQLPGEERSLIPSPRDVKTYDLKPEMSALEVKETVVSAILSKKFNLIVVNFANCDMVGHTGVLSAGIKAVEYVDMCLAEIILALKNANGQMLVIADHGNAELMLNYSDDSPHTAHTTFPVPCVYVGEQNIKLSSGGALCDVAPTMLEMLGLKQPLEMSGSSLFEK